MTLETFEMEYMYDNAGDILGFRVNKPYSYKVSIELDKGIILDFDEEYVPVALEILDASKLFDVPRYSLNNINDFRMNINISENIIELKASFSVLIHNKITEEIIDTAIGNISNFPVINRAFASV